MRGSRSAHSRPPKREIQSREGARSAYHSISTQPLREKKAEVIKNLKYLEDENQRLTDFMKRLGVLAEKIKHKGALIKHDIACECDSLVKIIEKKKRSMISQVDRKQAAKVRELEVQLTGCRRVFSSSHSVVVRTNRDLQHLSSQAFLIKGDVLIRDINRAMNEHPQLRPDEDDEYNVEVDLTEQKDALDRMELAHLDSESGNYDESESRESKSQSSTRSHPESREGRRTASKKHLIQKLMDDEQENGKKERTKQRRDDKQTTEQREKQPHKRAEKEKTDDRNTSNDQGGDSLEQEHETKNIDNKAHERPQNGPSTQVEQNQPEKDPVSPRREGTKSPNDSEDRPQSSKPPERKSSQAAEEVPELEEITDVKETRSQKIISRSSSASTIKSESEIKQSDTPAGSRHSLKGDSAADSDDIFEQIEAP